MQRRGHNSRCRSRAAVLGDTLCFSIIFNYFLKAATARLMHTPRSSPRPSPPIRAFSLCRPRTSRFSVSISLFFQRGARARYAGVQFKCPTPLTSAYPARGCHTRVTNRQRTLATSCEDEEPTALSPLNSPRDGDTRPSPDHSRVELFSRDPARPHR